MYLDPLDTGFTMTLLVDGYYEKVSTELFKRQVEEGMTIVDIGAHWGYYTLLAARLVGQRGRVFAFEPEPYNYGLLLRNIRANGCENVIAIRKAVSDKAGTAPLFVSLKNMGDHRIYDPGDSRRLLTVETVTLDDFFLGGENRIDVIKIDTQGSEMAVLRGMRKILRNSSSLKIITEFWPMGIRSCGDSPEEFLRELMTFGFHLHHVDEQEERIEAASPSRLIEMCGKYRYINLFCSRDSRSLVYRAENPVNEQMQRNGPTNTH